MALEAKTLWIYNTAELSFHFAPPQMDKETKVSACGSQLIALVSYGT